MSVVLMYSFAAPSKAHVERLGSLPGGPEIVVADSEDAAIEAAPEAEIILGHRYLRQVLPYARRLRWVQSSAGGVDRLPVQELLDRRIVVTRTTIFSDVIAFHALAMAMALTRAFPAALESQRIGQRNQHLPFLPLPRTALVLGSGIVGSAIAARLRSNGLRVLCARTHIGALTGNLCDEMHDAVSWRSALPRSDWCFLALPKTAKTVGVFDEQAMRSLPAHAIIVNVGRGETLDTAALVRVLEEGHLGGAALDVIEPSPSKPTHPLWRVPRLIITPHVAAHHPGRADLPQRAAALRTRGRTAASAP